jgi:hypothetical protein
LKLPLVARELTSYDVRTKLSNFHWNEIQQLVFASQFSEIVLVTGMEKQCRGLSYDVQDQQQIFLLPLSELGVVSALVSHNPADIQKVMLSECLKTLQDTVAFLAKIHSRESTKDTFKENRRQLKRTQNGDPPS